MHMAWIYGKKLTSHVHHISIILTELECDIDLWQKRNKSHDAQDKSHGQEFCVGA